MSFHSKIAICALLASTCLTQAALAVGVASFTAGVGTSAKAACVKHVDANKAQMAIFE